MGKVVLAGDNALALWRQGKDAWNAWIAENPEADIDFSYVDFIEERERPSFDGFHFGYGDISFISTIFGNREVTFDEATFKSKLIKFTDIKFINNGISFNKAIIDCHSILFQNTEFNGNYVDFTETEFLCNTVLYHGVTFNNRSLIFNNTFLNIDTIYFFNVKFNGDLIYMKTYTNSEITILFHNMVIKNGSLNIIQEINHDTIFDIDSSHFGGPVDIKLTGKSPIFMSFQRSRFDASLSLKGKMDCIADFRLSKISHHLDISEFRPCLKRITPKPWI